MSIERKPQGIIDRITREGIDRLLTSPDRLAIDQYPEYHALFNTGIAIRLTSTLLGVCADAGYASAWAPEHNANGPEPRVWVVTLATDGDGYANVRTVAEARSVDLFGLYQIDVSDSDVAIDVVGELLVRASRYLPLETHLETAE